MTFRTDHVVRWQGIENPQMQNSEEAIYGFCLDFSRQAFVEHLPILGTGVKGAPLGGHCRGYLSSRCLVLWEPEDSTSALGSALAMASL